MNSDLLRDEPSSPMAVSSAINLRDASPSREVDTTKRKLEAEVSAAKRKGPAPGGKVSAEILQRRKEGRIKAAATMAARLEELGIQRQDKVNDVAALSIRAVTLINQKNYFTDYLKRDEQVMFVRKVRESRAVKAKPKEKEFDIDNFELTDLVKPEEDEGDSDSDGGDGDEGTEGVEGDEDSARVGKTIVIHPGSRNLRVGFEIDVYPKTVPVVIARKRPTKEAAVVDTPADVAAEDAAEAAAAATEEAFLDAKKTITKDFRERMRYYKRRILPNSHETVANFNLKQTPEEIPDLNDPHKIDWLEEASLTGPVVGAEALRLASYNHYQLRWPLTLGGFNDSEYMSREELLGDLQLIIRSVLRTELDVAPDGYSVVLLIPDLYDKTYCEEWVSLLMQMLFKQVAVIQESVAATFGAGVSSACVVDIGATTTKVSCVDEGMVHADSRVRLDYGSDNITELFTKMLLASHFPFQDIDLKQPSHWEFADQLKQKFVTFLDGDVAVQLYNFHRRVPGRLAAKIEFKVFDDVMLSPMGVFFPRLFQIAPERRPSSTLFSVSKDPYTMKGNNPYSRAQETLAAGACYAESTEDEILHRLGERDGPVAYAKPKPAHTAVTSTVAVVTPLEKAVIESITNACKGDLSKFKRMYENLMLVGGGAKIPGFDFILTDRINIWRPRLLSSTALGDVLAYVGGEYDKVKLEPKPEVRPEATLEGKESESRLDSKEVEAKPQEEPEVVLDYDKIDQMVEAGSVLPVEVLAPPKDIDPLILAWKGGSVYSRLKIVLEMWITREEWDMFGGRCLHYKSLFHY